MTKNQEFLCKKVGVNSSLSPLLIRELKGLEISGKTMVELTILKGKISEQIDSLFEKIITDISLESTALKEKNLMLEKENSSLKKERFSRII